MLDITRLTQVQNSTYRSSSGGEKSASITSGQTERTPLPSDQVTQGSIEAAVARDNAQQAQIAEQSQRIDIFVVRDNVFSLYKLPNGELFSKVRNLKTGEEKVFPSLDSLSYFEAIRGNRGIFFEQRV